MAIHNADIAAVFEEMADLLEIEGANPFRVRAYRNAARTLRGLGREVSDLIARGEDLTDLPGIGRDLAAKIEEMLATGKVKALRKLKREVPESLEALLNIPGLGPKRVKVLHEELGINTLGQLAKAARDGRLCALAGFGAKTEANILEAVGAGRAAGRRFLRAEVESVAERLLGYVRSAPGVEQAALAGSFRRERETVGDLDILIAADDGPVVMDRFVEFPDVDRVVSRGTTRSTVVLRGGLQVDLRVVARESYGAALHYFTGSKSHNIAIRRLGQQAGLKINEYGVFAGERRIAGETEASVFKSLGLPYIEPVLREDRGEIDAARRYRLPALIVRADLRGDFHAHTDAGGGAGSLEDMAAAARVAGLDYLAITDDSRRLGRSPGRRAERLLAQGEAIDRLNDRLSGLTLLKGVEVDVQEDGELGLPDAILARLDLVVAAVHDEGRLSRKRQTERILRAMDHAHVSLLAHPAGRLLLEREGYDVDMERVIDRAAKCGCLLEINSQPRRLDLDEHWCRIAKERGARLCINSDARGPEQFAMLRYGVDQARRGWLEPGDVLNTRGLREVRSWLARAREADAPCAGV